MWFRKRYWCCSLFESRYGNAGHTGPAFIASRDYFGEPAFTLQFRAFEKDVAVDFVHPAPMTFISDSRFFHCPYCGTNLKTFYGSRVDELDRPGFLISEANDE